MSVSSRHLRSLRCRASFVALTLCLWLAPPLTMANELHETVHQLAGDHPFAQHDDGHHDEADHDAAPHGAPHHSHEGDEGSPLHALVHGVHSCGSTVALLPTLVPLAAPALCLPATVVVRTTVHEPPASQLLRPPRPA
jgi:hypothetical protein